MRRTRPAPRGTRSPGRRREGSRGERTEPVGECRTRLDVRPGDVDPLGVGPAHPDLQSCPSAVDERHSHSPRGLGAGLEARLEDEGSAAPLRGEEGRRAPRQPQSPGKSLRHVEPRVGPGGLACAVAALLPLARRDDSGAGQGAGSKPKTAAASMTPSAPEAPEANSAKPRSCNKSPERTAISL